MDQEQSRLRNTNWVLAEIHVVLFMFRNSEKKKKKKRYVMKLKAEKLDWVKLNSPQIPGYPASLLECEFASLPSFLFSLLSFVSSSFLRKWEPRLNSYCRVLLRQIFIEGNSSMVQILDKRQVKVFLYPSQTSKIMSKNFFEYLTDAAFLNFIRSLLTSFSYFVLSLMTSMSLFNYLCFITNY